jgi:hypothetical protein
MHHCPAKGGASTACVEAKIGPELFCSQDFARKRLSPMDQIPFSP